MRRKFLSLVTVLAMCLTMLPVPGWAAETGDADVCVISEPADILGALRTEQEEVDLSKAVTVEGNKVIMEGFNVIAVENLQINCDLVLDVRWGRFELREHSIQVESGKKLTIVSEVDTPVGSGSIHYEGDATAIVVMQGGHLEIDAVRIFAESGSGILVAPEPQQAARRTELNLHNMGIIAAQNGIYVHEGNKQLLESCPVLKLDTVGVNASTQTSGSAALYLAGMADTTITRSGTGGLWTGANEIGGVIGIRIQSGILNLDTDVNIEGNLMPDTKYDETDVNLNGPALLIENRPDRAGNIQVNIREGASLYSWGSHAIYEQTAEGWKGAAPQITIDSNDLKSNVPVCAPIKIEHAQLNAANDLWKVMPKELQKIVIRGNEPNIDYAQAYKKAGLTLSGPFFENDYFEYGGWPENRQMYALSIDKLKLETIVADPDDDTRDILADETDPETLNFCVDYKMPASVQDRAVSAWVAFDGQDNFEEVPLDNVGGDGFYYYIPVYSNGSICNWEDNIFIQWRDKDGRILAVTQALVHRVEQWPYYVHFVSNGESYMEPIPVSPNEPVAKPADPTREGFTFGGWFRSVMYKTEWNFDDPVTKNVLQNGSDCLYLYAQWLSTYTVSFDTQIDTEKIITQEVGNGRRITNKPADPKREGYTFGGWYREKECTTAWNFEKDKVTGDLTLYAQWLSIYTVTFDTDLGGPVSSQKVTSGEKISSPGELTHEGYTFVGWYKDQDYKTKWDFATDTVTDDITLYAKWEVKPEPVLSVYTVTFDTQLGGPLETKEVTDGSMVSRPADPAREGYDFGGWYKERECINPWDFSVDRVRGNITLYARWAEKSTTPTNPTDPTPGSYTVTFDSQGGSAVAAQTVTGGGKAARPADPTRSGYTFGGWFKEAGCTNAWNFDADTVGASLTLYAKWTSSGSGSIGGEYLIRVRSGIRYGEVSLSHSSAQSGTRVTITVTPDSDARLSWVEAESESGYLLDLDKNGRRYTFTMPSSNVTVDASFNLRDNYYSGGSGYSGYSTSTSNAVQTPPAPSFTAISRRGAAMFQDVPATSWAYTAAQWAYQNGYLSPAADGQFHLSNPVSHQEMWRLMAHWLGSPATDDQAVINWARQSGAANGSLPNGNMTRQDVVMYLYKCYFLMGGDVSTTGNLNVYSDAPLIRAQSARNAWLWAVEKGIISGNSSGRLDPTGMVSRGEFATILMRLCQG